MKRKKWIFVVLFALVGYYLYSNYSTFRTEFEYGINLPNSTKIISAKYCNSRIIKFITGIHCDGNSNTELIIEKSDLPEFLTQFESYFRFGQDKKTFTPIKGAFSVPPLGYQQYVLYQPYTGAHKSKLYGDYLNISLSISDKKVMITLSSDWN